jgi:thiamine kinase-like enzyme
MKFHNGKSTVSSLGNIIRKKYHYLSEEKLIHEEKVGTALNGITNFVHTIGIENDCLIMSIVHGEIFTSSVLTPDQQNSAYRQLRSAIKEANQKLHFTHYDLSGSNIIITCTDLEYVIRSNGDVIQSFGIIPIIIDFEYSYCEIDNQPIFRTNNKEFHNYDLVRLAELFKIDLGVEIPDHVNLGIYDSEFSLLDL